MLSTTNQLLLDAIRAVNQLTIEVSKRLQTASSVFLLTAKTGDVLAAEFSYAVNPAQAGFSVQLTHKVKAGQSIKLINTAKSWANPGFELWPAGNDKLNGSNEQLVVDMNVDAIEILCVEFKDDIASWVLISS